MDRMVKLRYVEPIADVWHSVSLRPEARFCDGLREVVHEALREYPEGVGRIYALVTPRQHLRLSDEYHREIQGMDYERYQCYISAIAIDSFEHVVEIKVGFDLPDNSPTIIKLEGVDGSEIAWYYIYQW